MGRLYAGILGPLAFLVCLARGAVHAWPTETILLEAWLGLLVFSLLGCTAGWLAGRIVDDEARERISRELEAREGAAPKPAA